MDHPVVHVSHRDAVAFYARPTETGPEPILESDDAALAGRDKLTFVTDPEIATAVSSSGSSSTLMRNLSIAFPSLVLRRG